MSPFWLSNGGGSHVTSSCVAVGPWTATLRGAAVGTGGQEGNRVCREPPGRRRWAGLGPEIPDPLLLGFLGQGRAGVGGGWKCSGAHLPPRQRPRAAGWRAPHPRRCTRSCGSHSACACSGLGATGSGETQSSRHGGRRLRGAEMTLLCEPGPRGAGPGKDREQLGGGWPAAGDALAHPWDPAQDATIPDAFRIERGTTDVHAGTTGANDTPGHRPLLPCLSWYPDHRAARFPAPSHPPRPTPSLPKPTLNMGAGLSLRERGLLDVNLVPRNPLFLLTLGCLGGDT